MANCEDYRGVLKCEIDMFYKVWRGYIWRRKTVQILIGRKAIKSCGVGRVVAELARVCTRA